MHAVTVAARRARFLVSYEAAAAVAVAVRIDDYQVLLDDGVGF